MHVHLSKYLSGEFIDIVNCNYFQNCVTFIQIYRILIFCLNFFLCSTILIRYSNSQITGVITVCFYI